MMPRGGSWAQRAMAERRSNVECRGGDLEPCEGDGAVAVAVASKRNERNGAGDEDARIAVLCASIHPLLMRNISTARCGLPRHQHLQWKKRIHSMDDQINLAIRKSNLKS